ncbi:MAG: biopolymer transporter ExbB [Paracoccaceae bacterium]|nr:biopolymer transporter ExbB [Paracoccaceae bacterium]MDG1738991.1 biopolymer transporter ExbB [Paracoccaceae bacterium]MDG2259755.1 biopolymer transporter ExbB [Paracoccaceae bacterium]
MSLLEPEVKAQFSQPIRQILLMLIVLGLTAALVVLAYPSVAPVFLANPWLNGVIIGVFFIGVLACFFQVAQLSSSVRWIEGFAAETPGHELTKAPRLLAPLAALLRSRGRQSQISSSSSRSILDSVVSRIEEVRDITRYIVNTLIFLGLLGTFYGLATTVPALVDTIRNLVPEDGENGVEVFSRLMAGLESQLGGMGIAFASSLLGLAGSLVVGLLELFAGHGQNAFYRELEEWLSSITRLGFASGDGETSPEQGAMVVMADHLWQQMEMLHSMIARSDENRNAADARLEQLMASMDRMTDRMRADDSETLLTQVVEGQSRLITALEKGSVGGDMDAESRLRLRSMDQQLLRILEELSAGRQEAMAELHNDISALNRSLQQLAPNRGPFSEG